MIDKYLLLFNSTAGYNLSISSRIYSFSIYSRINSISSSSARGDIELWGQLSGIEENLPLSPLCAMVCKLQTYSL